MAFARYRHLAIDRVEPPPTAEELAAIEHAVGTKLPAAFRDFLAVANGGQLDYEVDVPTADGHERCSFYTLLSTRHRPPSDEDYDTILGMLRRTRPAFRLPNEVLPFAEDAGSSLLFLDLTKEGAGRVVAWLHGEPAWTGLRQTNAFIEVAPSFAAYIDKLFVSEESARFMVETVNVQGSDVRKDAIREFLDIAMPDWRSRLGIDC